MTQEEVLQGIAYVSAAYKKIEKNPYVAENYYYLGSTLNNVNKLYKLKNEYNYNAEKNDKKAIEVFGYAIQLDPTFAKAYYSRGCMYFTKNEYNLCKADLEKAVALDPKNIEYQKMLEQLKSKLYEMEKAYIEKLCKAAEQGDANAQYELGCAYSLGKSVQKDETKAVEWYSKAAEQKNANAQYELGILYINGRNKKLQKEGKELIRKAAAQGHVKAKKEKRINKYVYTWVGTFLFGFFGVDRFMRGQILLGFLKILSDELFIWWLIDWIIALTKLGKYGKYFVFSDKKWS